MLRTPQRPGRHTPEGVLERLSTELTEARKERDEARGQVKTLTAERDEARGRHDQVWRMWKQADGAARHYANLLQASDGAEVTRPMPALVDDPEHFAALPEAEPVTDGPRLAAPVAPAVEVVEVVDLTAETLATDVSGLRAGLEATAVMPAVAEADTAVLPAITGPVKVTWGVKPLPPRFPGDVLPSEAATVATPVMALATRSFPVVLNSPPKPLIRPVSAETGKRAHESVQAAVGGAR